MRYAIIQAEERAKGAEETVLLHELPSGDAGESGKTRPYCDKFDRLRPAEEADECRLTELNAPERLGDGKSAQRGECAVYCPPDDGRGHQRGARRNAGRIVFFVAYRDYARAQEQLEALLAPDDHAADADFADEDEESEDEDE